MSLRVRDTGALRTTSAAYLRSVSGQQPIGRMSFRTATGLSEFYRRGIRAAANPSSVSGFSTAKTGPITTNTTVVSVEGGTGPYTYNWTATGGITVLAPTQPSVAFRATPPSFSGEITGSASCLITDASGLQSTVFVEIDIVREA